MALNRIQWAGRAYSIDLDSPLVGEMATMRMFTGLNWLPMIEEVRQGNDVALTAVLWMMLNRNGEPCQIENVAWPEGTGPMDLLYAVTNGEPVEADDGAADPNPDAAGSTPSSPPTSTSEPSEPTTSTPSPEPESPRRLSTA